MKHTKKWLKAFCLGMLLVGTGNFLMAQKALKRQADEQFRLLGYVKAIGLYEKVLKKGYDPDAIMKLAQCYRFTNNYAEASKYYEKAMLIEERDPEMDFQYGHLLLLEGNAVQARNRFLQFSRSKPDDPRGKAFAEQCLDQNNLYRDSSRYVVAGMPFNSAASDFGAISYGGGLIFASSRKADGFLNKDFSWLDAPFLNLLHVQRTGSQSTDWGKPEPLKGEINTQFHESNFSWSSARSEVYFTRNNYFEQKRGTSTEGVILLKIFSAKMDGLEGSEVKSVSFNNDNYSVGHPSLSHDGKRLYFASDMPGGFGGRDLYVSERKGEEWGSPVNLGPGINTPGDEMFPSMHKDGTLYFSSNGHPGLGHLDVFEATPGAKWSVRNMGSPINSGYDDFSPFINGDKKSGYFSSNRPGGAGDDDIYHFAQTGALVEVLVLDKVAQLPIEGAGVEVRNLSNEEVELLVTDANGRIQFTSEMAVDFDIVVKTLEFEDQRLAIDTRSEAGETFFSHTVELYNPNPAITAMVVDKATGERLVGSHILFKDVFTGEEIQRVSDKNGRFAIRLGEVRTYNMLVTHEGYLKFSDIVSTTERSYDGDTIIPLRLQKIRINAPIVLENIHYDYDKWFIRSDAIPDLMELFAVLKDNPDIQIELSSHTDSRGSDPYNMVLSRKRASSAKSFLIERGIRPNRIIPRGYGEARLVNECDDGVDCDEDKHFANRRTEFKIIGYISGIDSSKSVFATEENPDAPPKYMPEKDRRNPSTLRVAYNEPSLPDVADPEPGKITFKIKIGAFTEELAENEEKNFFEYKPHVRKFFANGKIEYYIGDYSKVSLAVKARDHLKVYGFKKARVVRWRDGEVFSGE